MAKGPGQKIYWDACIYIDGLRKTPGRIDAIQSMEGHARLGGVIVYASALILAEVNRADDGLITVQEIREIDRYFRVNKWIKIVPLDRQIGRAAAGFVRQGKVKPADAVHIATAAATGCRDFFTYDGSGGKPDGLLTLNGQLENVSVGSRLYVPPRIQTPDKFRSATP